MCDFFYFKKNRTDTFHASNSKNTQYVNLTIYGFTLVIFIYEMRGKHFWSVFIRNHICPLTQTPTQELKGGLSTFGFQENGSSIASFEMIFGALQFELFNSKLHSLRSKIRQIPGFNLFMYHGSLVHPPSVLLMTYSKGVTVML